MGMCVTATICPGEETVWGHEKYSRFKHFCHRDYEKNYNFNKWHSEPAAIGFPDYPPKEPGCCK